jgi:hypothetical protein
MTDAKLTGILAESETPELSWEADAVKKITESETERIGSGDSKWTFVATDERVVYREDGGVVKTLDYADIQAIEDDSDDGSRGPLQKLVLFYGAGLTSLGLYVMFEGNGQIGLVGFVVGVASIGFGLMIEMGVTDELVARLRRRIDGPEFEKLMPPEQKHTIRFVANGSTNGLEVATEDDIGAKLSEVVPERLQN